MRYSISEIGFRHVPLSDSEEPAIWPLFSYPPFPLPLPLFKTSPLFIPAKVLYFDKSLLHHWLLLSLSGCFRFRNSTSNTSYLTFANKRFAKFLSLVVRRRRLKICPENENRRAQNLPGHFVAPLKLFAIDMPNL